MKFPPCICRLLLEDFWHNPIPAACEHWRWLDLYSRRCVWVLYVEYQELTQTAQRMPVHSTLFSICSNVGVLLASWPLPLRMSHSTAVKIQACIAPSRGMCAAAICSICDLSCGSLPCYLLELDPLSICRKSIALPRKRCVCPPADCPEWYQLTVTKFFEAQDFRSYIFRSRLSSETAE